MEANNKWQIAAKYGLILSLVTIIYSLIQSVFTPTGFLSIILWIIKFGGCIWLLYWLMNQYSAQFEQISYGESFRFGFLTCCFSSIVCACFAFISMTLIFPDSVDQAMQQIEQTVLTTQSFSSEEEDVFKDIMSRLPQITLFSNLVYYIIIGAIMSSIIANFTKKTDPFADFEKKDEE